MIEIKNLKKKFGAQEVLKGINENIKDKEVVCVMGPSGSGKSTFLRCINLLDAPTEGCVVIDGKAATAKETNELRQQMGMVFQNFSLFPHMTVLENVAIGAMRVKGLGADEAMADAMELLAVVGLGAKAQSYPGVLSGGERQRVAIARAMALKPQVMLLDDPTSGLEREMAEEVLEVVRRLAAGGMTMVVVTREVEFAKEVADRVLFMDEGCVLEQGAPAEIFCSPKHESTKDFLRKISA